MVTDGKVVLKDATLREGLDTPNVHFSPAQQLNIARLLEKANLPEAEMVAPSRVSGDLEVVKTLKHQGVRLRTSGLIYAHTPSCTREIEEAALCLDRFDLLVPASPQRQPCDPREKVRFVQEAVVHAVERHNDFGVGFPHSFQTEVEFLLELAGEATRCGAQRVTVYDTNGNADPFAVHALIQRFKKHLDVALFFHGHNDLGLATANSLAAIYAGADGVDVTVNGLGDRAGNAALEQVAAALHLKGFYTGVVLQELKELSRTVAEASGVPVSKLAPVVGEYVFWHRSPSHLENPGLFEAFDPRLLCSERKLTGS
jgi:homocitrate synthase NifV